MPLHLDRYVRVSDVKGRSGASFIAPDVQDERICEWAQAEGHELGVELLDLDETGGVIDRPAFQLGLERVEEGLSDGFAVHRFDRFARSTAVAVEAVARIDAAGGHVFFVAEGLDNTKAKTAHGGMSFNLFSMVAQFERDRIREGWQTTHRKGVERGVFMSPSTPVGYVRDTGTKLLVPDPTTAPIVRRAFELRTEGLSWQGLAEWLRGRLGGGWTGQRARRLVGNRIYRGEIRFGHLRNLEAHEPLVTEEEWQAAQLARSRPRRKGDPLPKSILAGLVRCAGCGFSMRTSRGRSGASFECRGHSATGRCSAPSGIAVEPLERYVVDHFRAKVWGVLMAEARPRSERVTEARKELATAEERFTAYRDDDALREVLGGDYLPGVAMRKAALDLAREELARAEEGLALVEAVPRYPWEAMSAEDRALVLSAAIGAVFVRRSGRRVVPIEQRVRILGRSETPTDLPGRGKSVAPRSWASLWDGPIPLREAPT